MEKEKYYKNRGVERNKKPLQNIVYKVEISNKPTEERFEQYKFKDEGYLVLYWEYEKDLNKYGGWKWHGFITPEQLKGLIGDKQWTKFCNGKRQFIKQRRIDGKNISKK